MCGMEGMCRTSIKQLAGPLGAAVPIVELDVVAKAKPQQVLMCSLKAFPVRCASGVCVCVCVCV